MSDDARTSNPGSPRGAEDDTAPPPPPAEVDQEDARASRDDERRDRSPSPRARSRSRSRSPRRRSRSPRRRSRSRTPPRRHRSRSPPPRSEFGGKTRAELEEIEATGYKLYIGNLNFDTIERDMREEFERFGRLMDVFLPRDRNRRPRGFGFVTFYEKNDAEAAVEEMNGKILMGRELTVNFARPRGEDRGPRDDYGGGRGGYRDDYGGRGGYRDDYGGRGGYRDDYGGRGGYRDDYGGRGRDRYYDRR